MTHHIPTENQNFLCFEDHSARKLAKDFLSDGLIIEMTHSSSDSILLKLPIAVADLLDEVGVMIIHTDRGAALVTGTSATKEVPGEDDP